MPAVNDAAPVPGHRPARLDVPPPPLVREAFALLEAMPTRFSLGQILEEAERRGGTARQGYLHLQAFIAEGRVSDDGRWLIKAAP